MRHAEIWRRGYEAESYVEDIFRQSGCTILGRRVKTPLGEVDLVISDEETLVFIEVKLRTTLKAAARCLSPRQLSRVRAAAQFCIDTNPDWSREETRIDLIAIDPLGQIRRFKDIGRF